MSQPLIIGCNAWYEDEMGGAYRIASEFALHCARKGREVHFVAAHGQAPGGVHYTLRKGVNLWRYESPRESGGEKSPVKLWSHWQGIHRAARAIAGRLGSNSRPVVNGHTELQYWGLSHSLGKKAARKVLSVHSPFSDEYLAQKNGTLGGFPQYWAHFLLKAIEKHIYSVSDTVQCDSEFTAQVISKKFPNEVKGKLALCPGYVERRAEDLTHITRIGARERLRDMRWQGESTYFLTLRRLVPRTGVDSLIRAVSLLKQTAPFKVMIAGEGPCRTEYEKLTIELGLSDKIHFLGAVPDETLAFYYRAADCFVLPTRALECFGLVILESFASGTPVIATPNGAIPEVMGPYTQGLARDNTPEAIAERMRQFLAATPAVRESGQASFIEYAAGYEKNKVLDRLEALVMGNSSAV